LSNSGAKQGLLEKLESVMFRSVAVGLESVASSMVMIREELVEVLAKMQPLTDNG